MSLISVFITGWLLIAHSLLLHILDIFFVVFHSALIILNLFGWIWKKTRKLNLITLLLTGGSWLLLGMIVGVPGYCPLTDWHFNILTKLGETNLPGSYVKYLVDRLTGLEINASVIDGITLYSFIAALVLSVLINVRDIIKEKRSGINKSEVK